MYEYQQQHATGTNEIETNSSKCCSGKKLVCACCCGILLTLGIAITALYLTIPCQLPGPFRQNPACAGGFLASAKLKMIQGPARRRRMIPLTSSQMTHRRLQPISNNQAFFNYNTSTPTALKVVIVYAYATEGTEWNCPHGVDCPTFGPRGGDGPAELGDCIFNINRGVTGCTHRDCCLNAIIYENPGCCLPGYTPSIDTMDQCTFESNNDGDCQSACDVHHFQKPSECSEWPGIGPVASQFLDLSQGPAVVGEQLGATVLPIIKEDPYGDWPSLGGKFRGLRMHWGGHFLSNAERDGHGEEPPPPDGVVNFKFQTAGMSVEHEFFWSGGDTDFYVPMNATYDGGIAVAPGDGLLFQLDYDMLDSVRIYPDWEFVGAECYQCNSTGTPINCDGVPNPCRPQGARCNATLLRTDTRQCVDRGRMCTVGDVAPHVGKVFCLYPSDLNFRPYFVHVSAGDLGSA